MKTLWFTVTVFCLFTTINTTETEEILNGFSPETFHTDENDLNINNDESQEITQNLKTFEDEFERRKKLRTIQDDIAIKLQKALVKKLSSPEYSQRVNLTKIEKYLDHDLDVLSGRRSFNKEEESATEFNNTDDGRRNYVNRVTYVMDQPGSHAHVIKINGNNLQDQTGTRATYTVLNNGVPYQSLSYLDPKLSKITLPNYYVYEQPYLDFTNPIKLYYNYYPGTRFITFNHDFFDYSNHVRAQNKQYDYKQVTAYIISLMNADNIASPQIIQILKEAYDLNLAEINNFDRSQLVQISKSDLNYLKKYIILALNKYGMTPYVFRLLEYVNLIEGRPKNEVYLVFKILSNQQAVYALNRVEANELRAHLQYILKEYGKSPYIMPFVRNIGGIQYDTRGQNDFYDFDFGNIDPSSNINRDYMRKIYTHLSQIYNNNNNVLQILNNINRIYDHRNTMTISPKLNLQDYQNLYYLSRNDLYLLSRYISQIQKQRGDHTYLNELLNYINKLQSLDNEIDVDIIKDDNVVKGFDLKGLDKMLLDINNRNGLKPEITSIIDRLLNLKTVALHDTGNIIKDLETLKEYLIKNEMFEYDQWLIRILYELNNIRKDENQTPIEDDSEKWINIKIPDLELIYKYLISNERLRNNPYIIVLVNEIVQILQQSKLNPYKNVHYKFRYADLLRLYNNLKLYENDKENPIYVMILHYLEQDNENNDIKKHQNETIPIPIPDLNLIKEYFGDNEINLKIIYQFLLHEVESGTQNEAILDFLQFMKRTLLLPNGELETNLINLDETKPNRINTTDLYKLYLYIQKLIQDKIINVNLLKFYKQQKRKDEVNEEIFYNATKESLNRLRNFLLILIKEKGENPYILEVLIEINHILDIPDDNMYIINDKYPEVKEDDLILLIKYFTEINLTDNNNEVRKITEYLKETKDKIQREDTTEWISINAQDLELIYQYLLGKEKFLNSPYLPLFVNEILPLIQRSKQNPYEKVIYKFKYADLLQLYKLILSDEKDNENPVYNMILKYLDLDKDTKNNNGTLPDIDFGILKEYFGEQINLELIYKFLKHEVKFDNTNRLAFEMLRFINSNLLLPNGELTVKMINLNETMPLKISKDFQTLYIYLQGLVKDESIRNKLSEYIKQHKLLLDVFADGTLDTLNRVRNYLLKLPKEIGENRFLLDVLIEINDILGIPETYDQHENALNGTKYKINEDGIQLLIKHFTEINQGDNSEVQNILSYLYETRNKIYEENNTKDKLMYINVHDLEQIYQYLQNKDSFVNNPYLVMFINDVAPIIQQGKLNPYENLGYKLRHLDLQKIFNFIVSQEKDKENPVYKKILEYLELYKDKNNDTTPKVDLHLLYEYFGDDKVNLDIVYKFLKHEVTSGNTNEVIFEFLKFIENNLVLPNGQLRVKMIYFNNLELTGQINKNHLQEVYLYLQKLMEDDNIRNKLLDYFKVYRQISEIFLNASKESLSRIRNFLIILTKQQEDNSYIRDVLLEVNIILGIPESKNNQMYIINGTTPEINEEDLKLLIKYFNLVNVIDNNNEIRNIIEFLHETEERIRNNEEQPNKKWISINAQDLELIYQYLLGKEKFLNSPYLPLFVNEILPLIQRSKQNPYEKVLYKFKYQDLIQLYNTILKHDKDKHNPIYNKIVKYLDDFKDDTKNNGTTPDIDFSDLSEFFEDNKINIELLYKFLTHKIKSGSHSKVLIDLLDLIKRTLLLPNGHVNAKYISLSGTDPNLNPYDLQKLYLYLQKLIENENLGTELHDYIKKYKQKEKDMQDLLIDVPPESLLRLRNLLLIITKQLGENPFVLDILFEINHILGVPESNEKYPQDFNVTNHKVNEKELDLLIKYFTEMNMYGNNSDLINILNYLLITKEQIKHDREDSKGPWVSINVRELELIYQYLLSDEKFLSNPFATPFINEIRPLIQIGKEHPNENLIYKFKVSDLLKIYEFLVTHENYNENPVFIKIIHYLEQVTNNSIHDNGANVDKHVLNEYFGDQLNLDIVYKYLLHKIENGDPSNILIKLLDVLKRIQLPNGQFVIKNINLNDTEPKEINPNDLREIYLYLQRIINDNTLNTDLIQFYRKLIQQQKEIIAILDNTSTEPLNTLRNQLLILVQEGDRNPVILEIILQINRILGLAENDDKQYDANPDEKDLEKLENTLLQIKGLDNVDTKKIIENIKETEERIKEQQENIKNSKLFKAYLLEIIDNKNVSPDVKFILDTLLDVGFNNLNQTNGYSEFDTVLRKTIENLNVEDLNVLIKCLQLLTYKFKPVYLVRKLLPYVEKVRENYKNDSKNNHDNNTYLNEDLIVNVTRYDLDNFNKYLLDLINNYGENSNIINIIYKINNIKEIPSNNNDLLDVIRNNKNNVRALKVGDINEIITAILKIIEKEGATPQLIELLRDFSKLPRDIVHVTNRKVIPVNSTHSTIVLDNDDANKIQSYLVKIINEYGTNPYLVQILKVINPKHDLVSNINQTNVYTFAKLNPKDLEILTDNIVKLLERGANPELIEILHLIYEINGDVNKDRKEKKKQYVLDISKEIKKLLDNNIIETMRNMDKNTLISLYIDMIETIFNTPGMNKDFTNVMVKLFDMYEREESPVKKYIILKWYEYLIRNKGVSYDNLKNPDFINNLLEIDDNKENDRDIVITTEKYPIVTPKEYTSDIEKILSDLIDNTSRNEQTDDSIDEDISKLDDDREVKPELRVEDFETEYEGTSCIKMKRKYKNNLRLLEKIKKKHRYDIHLTDLDLERIFEIVIDFANQLKDEQHGRIIPTKLVIDELENRLLSKQTQEIKCKKSDTVNKIIARVVVHLRDIITYLKSVNFTKEEIMIIVKSTLEEDIIPDIKAISIKECTSAADKEILEALLANICTKTFENDDLELENIASDN